MAALAVHAALRAELAFSATGRSIGSAGIVFGVLAVSGAASGDTRRSVGCTHDDFWRDLYFVGSADSLDRGVCKSLQLCGTIRPRKRVTESRARACDAGKRIDV